jgi:hypothetical protein
LACTAMQFYKACAVTSSSTVTKPKSNALVEPNSDMYAANYAMPSRSGGPRHQLPATIVLSCCPCRAQLLRASLQKLTWRALYDHDAGGPTCAATLDASQGPSLPAEQHAHQHTAANNCKPLPGRADVLRVQMQNTCQLLLQQATGVANETHRNKGKQGCACCLPHKPRSPQHASKQQQCNLASKHMQDP